MPVSKPEAFRLMHEGAVALAYVEHAGIRVDMDYITRTVAEIGTKVKGLEDQLRATDVYHTWRRKYGSSSKLTSPEQLGDIFFNVLGHKCAAYTDGSYHPDGTLKPEEFRRPKTDKEAFKNIDLPFVKDYFQAKGLRKARTSLESLRREVVDGYFHPIFNLHIARSFRSSSGKDSEESRSERDFNFQNIDVRNPEKSELIRRCFLPHYSGWYICEIDQKQLEVRVSADNSLDPKLIAYCNDPTKDMHGDMTQKIFFCAKEEVSKTARDFVKAMFVFRSFYGGRWFQAAPGLWEAVASHSLRTKIKDDPERGGSGESLYKRLKQHGIKELGDAEEIKDPSKGTFMAHLKAIEEWYWGPDMFGAHDQWRERFWKDYLANGGFWTLTGFWVVGVMRKNVVTNGPIQGPAFHILLWSLIQLQKWLLKYKMRSKIIGQIHDSLILTCPPDELDDVLSTAKYIMTNQVRKAWKWLMATTLEVDAECSLDNWYAKKPYKFAA